MIDDGDNMIRTQVSLDPREYQLVKREARTLGISVAEFVRRAIRLGLPARGQAPWMRYAGLVESGNPRSSQTVDDVVYGSKD
jgi:Ribbon-helix-helix protein, copG family